MYRTLVRLFTAVGLAAFCGHSLLAHEGTLKAARAKQRQDHQVLLAQADKDQILKSELGVCNLSLELVDARSGRRLPGNVKITRASSGEAVVLSELISRPKQWFSTDGKTILALPQSEVDVAAFQGLETHVTRKRVDLRGKPEFGLRLKLTRFYTASDHGLIGGNTHLHLNRVSRKEADRYLRTVPAADDIDLLYVSHLRRVIDDESYITNEYDAQSLAALSSPYASLRYGEEHRHNFGKYEEGYGHVMFLDIRELVEPVSLGPGLTGQGTDGVPLLRGITQAKLQQASVIWCHNTFGIEDLPNFMAGNVQMLNIFDGGEHGSYKDSYYKYLNLGLSVSFSTGTDWLVYDLSRAYVPSGPDKSSPAWLEGLSTGRSYITNGTFLELRANDAFIGETIRLEKPGQINVVARGLGRTDFQAIELIHNGEVANSFETRRQGDQFEVEVDLALQVDEPGWIALRVPLKTNENEFGHTLFAHTSPIYVEIEGQRIFRQETAQQLLVEMERSIRLIERKGVFASDAERQNVLKVHQDGIAALQKRMRTAAVK